MGSVMVRKAVLDEIAEEAKEQAVLDYEGVGVEELLGVTKQAGRLMVREGENSRPMTFRAANLISTGLEDPQWLAGQFDERTPDFWSQYWQEDEESTHPHILPKTADDGEITEKEYGEYANSVRLRSRDLLDFWAEIIADIEKDDVSDDHFKRYYVNVYLSLIAGNHRTLNVGLLPWGGWRNGDAIAIGKVPKWIYPKDPEQIEESEHETSSAADADW